MSQGFTRQPIFPPGILADFAGTAVPAGWLACDGSAVSRTTYAELFNAIGETWGAGDGSTTFNVPDFRRRVAVGSGGTGSGTLGNAVGNTGGAETVTLTVAQLPATAVVNVLSGAAFTLATPGAVDLDFGDAEAHNNMQPSAVVLKIIKV